ncbi:MAG: hypothetical protein HS116_02200 [Planctomycetes bacterium]|nr:hypothetical protein [Planctomycetota bacterium]
MKLSELIAKVEAVEPAKALAGELRTALAAVAELDTAEIVSRAEKFPALEKQVGELSADVKKLGDEAKGAAGLKEKVAAFEGEKREGLLAKAFEAAAKEAGVNPKAVASARKLADLAKVTVDLAAGKVEGIGKELFESLKKDHPVLFGEAAKAEDSANIQTIPALAAAASGAAGAAKAEIPGAVGKFLAAARL